MTKSFYFTMTDAQVKAEWRMEYERASHVADICETCGEHVAEYLNGSGFMCELCAESAIEYGRIHVSEAYEE